MKLFLLLFVASSVSAVNHPNGNRASHPYEFVRTGSSRVNDVGSKAPHLQTQFNRLKPSVPSAGEKSFKKTNGVPPYAVLMEPLVKYSQPDPLYNEGKDSAGGSKAPNLKSDLKVKREETKDETTGEKQIASKSGGVLPYEDQEGEATGFHHKKEERHRLVALTAPGIYYEGPPPTEPEPIIEIIIKESNESLPTPPPIPTTTRKKKKEQVQVFYVKYKKDPSAHYGEDKIIYDAPVPAVTPPTNNADPHEHEEEEEAYHHHHHHEEDVTLPPRPSTTLKAIIKPDSEVYHGSGGVRITFGGPKHGDEEGYLNHHHHHHYHHRGDYEEQSAPEPSVLLPPKRKASIVPKANSESQLTKRNPAPFHSQTQPPQQSFNNGPSVTPPRDFHRPTPLPTFQQTPQFPAQAFKPQSPKVLPSQPPTPSSPPRPSPTRYSTLPQHLQTFPKPQNNFGFPPPRSHPPQQPVQQPIQQPTVQSQQYYSINQPHLKSSFHVRQTPPQQYQTISNQAAQQHGFPKSQPIPQNPPLPTFHQPPKTFPQPTQSFVQPSLSFPQAPNSFPQTNTFSQVPQQVLGPIIQRSQTPFIPQQNSFVDKPTFPPRHHQQQQHHQQLQQHQQQQQQLHHQQQQQLHHQQQQQQHHQQQQIHHQQQQQHHQQQQQQHLQQQHHHQQVEQLNRLQQQQQRLQSQVLDHQRQNIFSQQKFQTTSAPEIIKSISPELPFANHRFENPRTQVPIQTNRPTSRPQISHTVRPNTQFSFPKNIATTTESFKKYAKTTQPPVEYVTEDPKKAEEERRKKEEKKKQNVAALPDEVPDDLREQLLSSGILSNADIQILDYDKIGDIPIESLPPEALANFQAVAGSEPVPSIVKPDSKLEDAVAEASEQSSVVVAPNVPSDVMEMKVVRYNPDSKEGSQVPNQYVKEGATQLEPVVLNDSKYNRYLPLKVAGAQFPVPDVPELRGKNVTSVVVLAPVDYEFLQRHEDVADDSRAGRRSSHPVLEVQGVHFVAGDVLKALVKTPTSENYRKWLDRENRTSLEKQSVVLLVIEPNHVNNSTGSEKEIFMYDIGTQKVSKLSGELSAQFVEVAESNSENDDLEEISDTPGGDFTVTDTSEISPVHVRTQRKTSDGKSRKNKSKVSPR